MSILANRMAATGWTPKEGSSEWGQQAFASTQVEMTPELVRILTLPRRVIDLNTVPDLSPLFVHTEYCGKDCGGLCGNGRPAGLRPIQSAALWEMDRVGGLLGPIGVGHGKELICALAGAALDAKCTVILGPTNLREHFKRDWERYKLHFTLPENVHFVSYNDLSNARLNVDAHDNVLTRLKPDLIVANEAHKLRNRTASCTKRFLTYMKLNPGCRFVAVSGTMTNDSIKDYARLSEIALGRGSPLPSPSQYGVLSDWANALDVPKPGIEPAAPGALLRLMSDTIIQYHRGYGRTPTEIARIAFQKRLVETQGVIATEAGAIGCSLMLTAIKPNVPQSVKSFLTQVEKTWAIPGGDTFDSALTLARVCRQVSCGFYYEWDWSGEPWYGVKDQGWLGARARWNKAVRHVLTHCAKPGLDSPLFVARAAALGHPLAGDANAAWGDWSCHKNKPMPETKTIWLDDFLVKEAELWGNANKGIIWYAHTCLGEAIATRLGVPLLEGGTDNLIAFATPQANPVLVCSIAAHGTGKNLQAWSKNLATSPPSNGTTWEQMIGRTHRPGQKADEVEFDILLPTHHSVAAFDAAVNDAHYQQMTTGAAQKLIYASKAGF